MITNNYGAEILKNAGFDEITTDLEGVNIQKHLFAYAKIYSCALQTEPFIHIDNDAYFRRPLTEAEKTADFLFQHKEIVAEHPKYRSMITRYKKVCDKPLVDLSTDFAVCCGVIGTNRLDIIKEWKAVVDRYLAETDLTAMEFIWQNFFFEQYFIATLAKGTNIHYTKETGGFTHLWDEKKRSPYMMQKVREKLYAES